MASRRTIKGVLHNFLGRYTSRYSDFNGYWLFGFLVEGAGQIRIDLMEASSDSSETTPLAAAGRLAVTKFAEQLEKAGLPKAYVCEAYVDIAKSSDLRPGVVNGHVCSGYDVRCLVQAITDLGRTYESTWSIFVAPHNPKVESRSARAT